MPYFPFPVMLSIGQLYAKPANIEPIMPPTKGGRFMSPMPSDPKLYGGMVKYTLYVVTTIENQARREPYVRAEKVIAGKVARMTNG